MKSPTLGSVVLCGGESRRMGLSKADLPFGKELLVERVVRLLGELELVEKIVVVRAPGQQLPALPAGVLVTEDRHPGRGPLEGLMAGLKALQGDVDAAYVTACDAPLLQAGVVERLWQLLEDNEIVVPTEGGRPHPLAAIYRVSVHSLAEQLLAEDQRRPAFLFERAMTRKIPVTELKGHDPELLTFQNMNEPADYLRLLKSAGLELPVEIARQLNLNQVP